MKHVLYTILGLAVLVPILAAVVLVNVYASWAVLVGGVVVLAACALFFYFAHSVGEDIWKMYKNRK